jgi:thiamine-phosphate pyrophosphorylase
MSRKQSSETAIWRIIDANLNRAGEGLRFLEEIARLALDDSRLTGELKALRHDLIACSDGNNALLLEARDSASDVGMPLPDIEASRERDLASLVVANARRVQEALRVMEELEKVPGAWHHSERYKEARFQIYNLERSLLSRLLRKDRLARICGVHLIIELENDTRQNHIELAQMALAKGIRVIRLEISTGSARAGLDLAGSLVSLCKEYEALFMVQSRLDLALTASADALHLKPGDLAIETARSLLPLGTIIGFAANSKAAAVRAQLDGADYIECAARNLPRIDPVVTLPLIVALDISHKTPALVINPIFYGIAVRAAALPRTEFDIILGRLIKESEGKP